MHDMQRGKNRGKRASTKHEVPPAAPSGDRPPRVDATEVAGLTALMNTANIKPGINLADVEQKVMGRTARAVVGDDSLRAYAAEIDQLAAELGAAASEFGDPLVSAAAEPQLEASRPASPVQQPLAESKTSSSLFDVDSIDLGLDRKYPTNSQESGEAYSGATEDPDPGDDSDESDSASSSDSASETAEVPAVEDAKSDGLSFADNIIAQLEAESAPVKPAVSVSDKHKDKSAKSEEGVSRPRKNTKLTIEQERQKHINDVISDLRGEARTSYSAERERDLDLKAQKLEEIDQLRSVLQQEGIDCDGVGKPTPESDIRYIDSVLSALKLKNDRTRYSTLAEEAILGAAEMLETVYDGTRKIPIIGWAPDYTGYHSTVSTKLHRMRFETSKLVGEVIERYNIGPLTRVMLELLPSFVLYPRQKRRAQQSMGQIPVDTLAEVRRNADRREVEDMRNI